MEGVEMQIYTVKAEYDLILVGYPVGIRKMEMVDIQVYAVKTMQISLDISYSRHLARLISGTLWDAFNTVIAEYYSILIWSGIRGHPARQIS